MYNPFYDNQGYGGRMGMWQDGGDINPELVNDVLRAIRDEVHAYYFYETLAEIAPTDRERQTIKSIQQDEARHYHWFTMILQRLGGQIPEIPEGRTPLNYVEGLKEAIVDELNAASFYQNVAYNTDDRHIQMHFMHASHDEQRHASWLQYMLTGMR